MWTESQTVVVANGRFNVILGSGDSPLDLPFDEPYYLGVTVSGDPEMTPRIELAASPYSLNVAGGRVVTSLNSLTDGVTLAEGDNVTITPDGNTLTISAGVDGVGITQINTGSGFLSSGKLSIC